MSPCLIQPIDQLGHKAGRIERRGRLKHNTDLLAVFVKGGHAVRRCFVIATMPFVFLAVSEKVAMELPDMVLSDLDVRPGMEKGIHDFGIAGYFLLVTGGERLDFEIAQQALNVTIRQFASFDASRRANTFDSRHAAQGAQSLLSQCARHARRP